MEDNVFEQLAKKYDNDKQIELAKIIVKEVKLELENSQSTSLIDYGCGTGLIGLELADQVESILFVDSSKEMLKIVEGKITKRGITNTEVLQSDFTKDSSPLNADIILMSLVLLHIPDTKRILQQLFTILNDGGKLIIVDFDKNDKVDHPKIHNGFTHEYLKNILSDTGFRSTKIKTFHQGSRIFAGQDASMFISASIK